MISSALFENKYNLEISCTEKIRNTPLSLKELKEAGLQEKDCHTYFHLVEELYKECLLFSPINSIPLIPSYYTDNRWRKIKDYIRFCYQHRFIESDYSSDEISFVLQRVAFVKANHPYHSHIETMEPIEEFRLRLEDFFSGKDDYWYMELRYNHTVCFQNMDGANHLFLFRYDAKKGEYIKRTYQETKDFLVILKSDLARCQDKMKSSASNRDEQIALLKEQEYLEYAKDDITRLLEEYPKEIQNNSASLCLDFVNGTKPETLYIYKGNISCKKHSHHIVNATAILFGRRDKPIELNVEYCTDCRLYLLEYSLYEHYKEQFGILIGNLKMFGSPGQYAGNIDLSAESPLKLSGYSVSQKDGLSSHERQYLLARIIYSKFMTKNDVIRYLSYFIRMQGSKSGNEIACRKWKDDLLFVQRYQMNQQPKVYIDGIQIY